MAEKFHVRVTKDYLVFSAAHFITFAGDQIERIHGHNYRVAVDVSGPIDENAYVVDFLQLRDWTKEITDRLDHHVVLPTESKQIHVTTNETEATVRFRELRWVFPIGDCVLLPMPNTTAEMLARFIGRELLERFAGAKIPTPTRIRVHVEENFGQWGTWESS